MNNGSNGEGKVELFFEFHTPREFTSLTLHLARGVATSDSTNNNNNNKTKKGLTGCLVNFAVTTGHYLGKVVRFVHHEEQETTTSIYNVSVDLKRRIGRYLKLELEFNSQWLLMSEVTFQSTLHDPNVTSTQQEQQEDDEDGHQPSEGPEIPIIDDGSSNMDDEDDDDDIFEEISTVAEDQRTAYIGLVGGVLSIVVLLLGTGLIVYLKRRKNRHGKQVAAILPGGGGGGGNGLSGDGLNKLSLTPRTLNLNDNKQRMTLLSLKQLGGHKNANSNLAPSARDGFYGPVISSMGESDSDTSSFYHEPYQQQQQQQPLTIKYSASRNGGGFQRNYSTAATAADPEYGCLIQKEPLLLTPKGLHSKGLFHHSNSTSSTLANKSGHNNSGGGHSSYTAIPLPRPPLSAVKQSLLLMDNPSNTMSSTTTSFTALPSENYYATTDLILVSFDSIFPLLIHF